MSRLIFDQVNFEKVQKSALNFSGQTNSRLLVTFKNGNLVGNQRSVRFMFESLKIDYFNKAVFNPHFFIFREMFTL